MATRIQLRRGTAAAWASANPVLFAGEPAVETDTGKLKLGDGTSAWSALPYILDVADLVDSEALRATFERRLRIDVRDYMTGGEITAASMNAALDDADNVGVFGELVVPGGFIELDAPVILRQGVLITCGGGHDAATSRPGTQFGPAAGYTGVGFHFPYDGANLWHHGGLRRMRARGFASHGTRIEGGLGEGTVLDDLAFKGNGGDGLRIEGPSTPSMIGRIGVYENAGAGLRLVTQTETHTQILYLAGDNNGEALMTVEGLDAESSVSVIGWKAERWNNGQPSAYGHPNVFRIIDGNGGLVDLGTGRVQVGSGATVGNSVIRQEAAADRSIARIVGRYVINDNSGTGGYAYGYEDVKNAQTYTPAQMVRRQFRIGEPVTSIPAAGAAYVSVIGDIGGRAVYAGTVNPNSNVAAPPGSIYLRENSGTDGRIYKKTGGAGTTTWEEMLSTDPATVGDKTAPSAGTAAALPATPNGYMTVMVQGVARKIAYY